MIHAFVTVDNRTRYQSRHRETTGQQQQQANNHGCLDNTSATAGSENDK
jgi:hypothetical protein